MTLKVSRKSLVLLLLAINTFGSVLWIFELHTIRLIFLSGSSLILLSLFFIEGSGPNVTFIKLWIVIMFIIGLKNIQPGYLPILIVDLSSLGIICSAYLLKNIDEKQLQKVGVFLVLVPAFYYIYTIPMLNLSLINSGTYSRELAFDLGDKIIAGGASKAYVIYMTQQLMTLYLNLFLLSLPLFYHQLKRPLFVIILVVVIMVLLFIAAYYQKRQGLLEVLLILVLSGLFYRKNLAGLVPTNLIMYFFVSAILALLVLKLGILDNTINRLEDLQNNVEKFDRIEESMNALSQFSTLDWVFGKGFGSFIPRTAGYSMLHIGYSNLILKGGLVFLLIYIINSVKNLRYCWKSIKRNSLFSVGVVISIYSMLELLFTGGYHFYAPVILTGLSMFSRFPLESIVSELENKQQSIT